MKRFLRFFFLIVSMLSLGTFQSLAQTTLIDPTGAGGFESGATFTDNGWTVVNGTVVNQWFVGTVPTGFTNNSAYVSNNSGAANAYTNTSTSVSHFYRDVTFPAGQTLISLSFNWMALGETNFFDGLLVSIAPTTYTPAASTTSLGTAALAAPAVEVGRFWNTSTPQLATVSIPASVAGNCTANSTVRLIFTWKNDNSGGSNPAAVVDNISLVSSVPNITSLGGTFTINNTLPTGGTNYQSFTAAINDLNAGAACGLTGPVVFNVSAGQTFNETPPVITASGTSTATITFQKSGTGNNPVITPTGTAGTNDGGIVISGGDYFTFDGIDINSSNSATLEYGYILRNITATDGAQFNIIKNCSITMTRAINTATGTSAAIIQSASTTAGGVAPTSAAGANSNNKYYNLTISNALNGVYLNGNGTNRDLNTEVGTTGGCSVRNTFTNLGPTVSTFTSSRGVYATGQENFKIFNSDFTSIAGNQGTTAGIYTTNIFGNANNVYGNKVSNVSVFGSTTTTSVAYGIYTDMSTTGTNITNIYNNSISNIFSSFSGTATTSVYSVGLYCGTASSTGAYNVDNNSVSIGAGLTPTYSIAVLRNNGSTCAYNVRNNVLANYTNAQTTARHMIWWTSSATSIGASSIVSNNDLFIANDLGVSGFTAVTNTTTRTTIADFDLAITTPTAAIEANSVTIDPVFLSNLNDLHVTNINLNNLGVALQSYVTNDLDCATRNDNDMGAYVITACSGSPNPTEALATTATSVCPNSSVSMGASGLSTEAGIVHQWQVSTVSGGPYTNVSAGTGANSANYNTGSLVSPGTYFYILSSTCTASGLTAFSNEVAVTVFAPPTITITPSNGGNFCGQGTLTASGALTYTWSPALFLETTTGSTVTSITTTNSTFSVIGFDANGCSNNATVNIIYTAPPAVSIVATDSSFCGVGGVSTLTANSATAYNYTWQAVDGATLSTTSGNSTDVTVNQTSAVKLTAIETASGCVNVQYFSIGVYPLPAATVTTSADGVCPGTSAIINSGLSAGNFTSQSIPHAPITAPSYATTLISGGVGNPAPQGTAGVNYDDGGWANIPIGFPFNFFGTPYSTINAGTNGNVMFGAFNATSLADFNFTTLPSTTEPFNMVALLAMDNDLAGATGGTVRYWTDGYAPNRRFIISYEAVKEFNDTKFSTVQGVFYETTGIIEVHVTSSTNVDRNKVVGVNNGNGTIGVLAYASGTTASATNPISNPFAFRFTPPSNYTTIWTANGVEIANGTNIFSQSVAPTVTTTYSISYTNQITGCVNAPGSAQVTMAVLGTVAPSNVTAQATVGTACSGVSFNLSTNYTGSTDGLTYQWQVSTDNGTTWTDITGANGLTYTTSLTTASSFRIGISSCGGTIEYSSVVSVALSVPTDCYCTPVYTTGTSAGDLISNVTIVGTTLSNNTGFVAGGPSYTFYTGQPNYTATLLPSTSYTLQVSTGEWGDQGYAAWIDYNDDGIFSASELIGATPTTIGSGLTSGQINASSSFTIALACTPPAGVHRMRIRGVYFENGPTIQPCATYTWGETEDYLITIAPAPTCPAPGAMTATTTSTTAPLSWNMGCSVATNFDFEYGPVGFTQGTGTAVNNQVATVSGTTGTFTLTGLTPNTQYSVYYRANCGNGDVSPWSVATNFTTLCAPISLNNPGNAVACDSYTLPALTEFTPSNNTGLTLSYYNGPNGTGGQITGPITTTQTVYARGKAGSCATDSVFTVTIYNTPQLFVQNPTICAGDSTVLWLTIGNAIDFVYTLNNNFIGSGITYHVSPTATTTYGISAVGFGGCISAEQQATVTVNQPTTSTSTATACDSYAWNGQTYTQSGTYTFTTTNASGCDSVATLNLTINNSTTGSETITACDSLVWNGQTYTQSGTYTYLTTNAVGCDSTVTLNLTINNSTTSSTNVTACVSYQWNGQTYTQSGVYTFTTTNAVGCDSVATLNLTINNALFTTETVSACVTYDWNGQTYTQSGTYTFLATSVNGCDSTVTLNLTINQPSTSTTTQTACDSYAWNGQTYTQSGTYVFNTTTVAGCDSTATLELTINNSSTSSTTQTACDSYSWNGQTYTQSGTYTYTTSNAVGCDSTVTLNLTINQPSTSTTTQTACDSYAWNGQTYTQSGTYVFNTTTVAGCDSTATLELTINNSSTSSTTQTACDSYSWNGQTYTQSGTYTYTTSNAVGCDSVATLVLTINNSTTSSTTQAACDLYTWNGQTYTQSGSYTYTTTNAAGCDSTATLILTINQSPSATATDNGDGTGTASAGATYQWIDCATNTAIAGATQQTFAPSVTGQYSVVVTNASGCSDTSSCITIDVSKLNELSSLNIQVNPNPSNGVFNLTMNTSVNGQIVVTDATGRIIATQSMNGTSSSIDLTNSVTGIYYFTVQFNDSEKVIRVIKN